MSTPAPPLHRAGTLRAALAATGDLVIRPVTGVWRLLGLGAGVVMEGLRPSSWRRTARAELVRHGWQMGITALPAVILIGALVGIGLVAQGLNLIRLTGQSDTIESALVNVLVRELAPVLIGLLVLGRSAIVSLAELHELRTSGKLHTLEAMGINPFHLLVLPRTVAMAVSCFSLTMVFLAVAVVFGFVGVRSFGHSEVAFAEFASDVLDGLGVAEFAIMIVKPSLIGFSISLVTCVVALLPAPGRSEEGLRERVPRAFVGCVVMVFLVSGAVSWLL